MPDLTTMHLKCLLEQANEIPQPTTYTYKGGAPSGLYEAYRGKESHVAAWRASMNLSPLAEAAPALAEEVIRLRDALGYLVEETRLAAENSDDVVVQKRVADAIKTTVAKIQGDHDE